MNFVDMCSSVSTVGIEQNTYLKLITFDNDGVGMESLCESSSMKFNTN